MIDDAAQIDDGATLQYDVCVLGAGAAGITIARALRGRGLSVCVLEGGGFEEASGERYDFHSGEETGPLELDLIGCRMRHFGGSTNHWGGWSRKLDPDVFDDRPWMPGTGWPLSLDELAPWYALARGACQLGADEWLADGPAGRSGIELLPLDPARVENVLYQYSPPTRFGQRYRDQLEEAEDVDVWLHANAVELVMAPGGDALARVRCAGPGDRAFEVEARATVVALGGIENARMLLASGPIGDGAAHVGRGFMEHPHFSRVAYLALDGGVDLTGYLERPRVLTVDADTDSPIEVAAKVALALPVAVRRAQQLQPLSATLGESDEDEFLSATGDLQAYHLGRLFGVPRDQLQYCRLTLRGEQAPHAEHRIRLGDDLDSLGVPRVSAHWDVLDADLESYRRTLRLLGAELGHAGVGRLYWHDDVDTIRESIWPGCHHMGSTRMAESPADGVVDADCRVHGVDNLWVAGSSVFPHSGYANPTLTLVALAYRLAETLAGELS